jgi:ABC-2 type transport system ATP-binding protein
MEKAMSAIEINSLTKNFGSFVAVDNISMQVREGEFMGLLGPNGAGKTTILKVLSGMIKPTAGNVIVNGYDCREHHKAMMTVGCVIETPECYPNFTPVEMLRYIGSIRGIGRRDIDERIRQVLEEVSMEGWYNEKIGKFSKGMKQRIALAQALLPDPDILILDEPTSGLDPRGMVEVREILKTLKSKGKTMLMSTHLLNEVSEICDSVTMIRQGRLVVSGNVKELLSRKEGDVEIEMQTRNIITKDSIDAFTKEFGVEKIKWMDQYTVTFRSPDKDAIYHGMDIARHFDLDPLNVKQKGNDLESLYMSLTADGDKNEVR